jgi:A118 family predicted phage portal protein
VFKFAISNNWDVRSPLGISVYAYTIGTLENIDEKYYSSRMDSINSRKKVFVDEEATKIHKTKDEAGNISFTKYFDQDETQFQVLKGMASDSNKAVEIFAPAYDSAQHDNAIQMELNYLSSKVGLGSNYYSYTDGAVGYQNEMNVIASNSDTFRNRQKNINRLKIVLVNMMKSILYLEKDNGNYNGTIDDLEFDVQFDDDIMTDDATVIEQYRKDAKDGLIPVESYLMKAYKITLEEAKEITQDTSGVNVTKINALSEAINAGAISIKEAQKKINPDANEDDLTVEYIITKVERGIPINPKDIEDYKRITGEDLVTPQVE